ncbi:hypothetical protein IFR09_11355 [Pseudomonas syringae]|nr:hypothetical protein [Pseudomonas syringae]MBD8801888.1 hypothetical protein [Pseudomonas syringae]MBD8811762.1 hypothetical protein [Pseudomonas syringae]
MALSEETNPYEILIRLNAGGIAGAHYKTLTEIMRDGVVISATENPPMQLATAEGQEGLSLGVLLGDVAANALIQIDQLTQRARDISEQNQSLLEQLNTAGQRNKDLAEQLQAALAEIERLTAAQTAEPAPEPEQA